jgi:hypothetical protein
LTRINAGGAVRVFFSDASSLAERRMPLPPGSLLIGATRESWCVYRLDIRPDGLRPRSIAESVAPELPAPPSRALARSMSFRGFEARRERLRWSRLQMMATEAAEVVNRAVRAETPPSIALVAAPAMLDALRKRLSTQARMQVVGEVEWTRSDLNPADMLDALA